MLTPRTNAVDLDTASSVLLDPLGLRRTGRGVRASVGLGTDNSYPANVICAFSATFPGGVLTVANPIKCAVIRMPAGLANGDFQITLSEDIDDAHYFVGWRINSTAATARLWPNVVGVGATPNAVKQLTLRNADGANTALDPLGMTITLIRMLQGANP